MAILSDNAIMNSGIHARLSKRSDKGLIKYVANQELKFHQGNRSSRGNS